VKPAFFGAANTSDANSPAPALVAFWHALPIGISGKTWPE
jgi:hypothetical protein